MPSLRTWFAGRSPAPAPALPEAKASVARRLAALTTAGRPQWTARDAAALAREGFAKNPVAYRCVRMIAEAAASIPLVALRDGARAPADDPLGRLLARPNPEEGGADLMERFFGALQTAGNAYLEAAGEDPGVVTEIYALRPDRVRVVPGPDGWPAAWTYAADGRDASLVREADGWAPVLHLKLFNPVDDLYGLSPLEAAAFAVDVHNASSAWNKALLDNAARPSGALVYAPREGERMSEEAFLRLKAELGEAHAGPAAAGRPLLLEGGLDWKPMMLTPAEMDFAEGKHAAAREIALAFGAPPQLLGIPGDATYSNYKEANAAFWRLTVVPLAQRAARALGAWLEPRFPGGGVTVDLDAAPALQAERGELWDRLDRASFLTPAERRRMAGLPEVAPDEAAPDEAAPGGNGETEVAR